jgi:hypothetical protein
MRNLRKFSYLLLVLTLLLSGQPSFASDSNAPRGISDELWNAYKEMALSELEGEQRNFRSAGSLSFYVKGMPVERDILVLDYALNTFAQHCQNITPTRARIEPAQGVIFHFIPRAEFTSVISEVEEWRTDSFLQWRYFKNRGIVSATALISIDNSTRIYRDYLIRKLLLQSLGFYDRTSNPGFNFFNSGYGWELNGKLTDLDRQLINFYCSNLVRAWDTDLRTVEYVTELGKLPIQVAPNFSNSISWSNNEYGIDISIIPRGDLIISNRVTKIGYDLVDSKGRVVATDEVEVSSDVFKLRKFEVFELESYSRYSLQIFTRNLFGKSSPQSVTVLTGKVLSKAKQEAEAKAAADLKAAQDKAAAELKAKQEAEAKAAADLKAAQDKAAAELKAKQEAEAKAAADLKAAQDKAAAELKAKQEAEAKAAAIKKTTITCVKGKVIKKVTSTKPKCPVGYKKK